MADTIEANCSNEEYHAQCSFVGKSMLDDFRRSRRLYEALYVKRTMKRPSHTAATLRGSLLHQRILEPDLYFKSVVIAPHFDRRTKIGKEAAKLFEDRARETHKTVIDDALAACVDQMAEAVKSNPVTAELLGLDGPIEHSISWTDVTGIECKARRDKVTAELILDIKTCEAATPNAFAKAAAYYGYNRQAAFYLDGDLANTGIVKDFVFIVVSAEPPYQAASYELDQVAIERGRQENNETLRALAECYQSGEWSDPWERKITRLALPDWAMRDDWRMA